MWFAFHAGGGFFSGRRRRVETRPHLSALEPGSVLSLDPESSLSVCAREGTVWLTQEGCGEDILLRAGQAVTTAPAGRVVVQALDCAMVAIRPVEIEGGDGAAAAAVRTCV